MSNFARKVTILLFKLKVIDVDAVLYSYLRRKPELHIPNQWIIIDIRCSLEEVVVTDAMMLFGLAIVVACVLLLPITY
jgi:hypothetical protein